MNDSKIVHVAMSIWDPHGKYSRHGGATMVSIMEHTNAKVCFHILHDETLTDVNREKFTKTADKYGHQVKFITVSIPDAWGISPANVKRYTKAMLFSLLLPHILPTDKVIHIDCDIIFTMDVELLWNLLDSDHAMAARTDTPKNNYSRLTPLGAKFHYCSLSPKYMPGGACFVLNLKRIRENYPDYAERITELFRRCKDVIKAYDETFFGVLFSDDMTCFPPLFHDRTVIDENEETKNIIFHLAGKPWEKYSSFADRIYWEALYNSAWGEDHHEFMSYVYEAMGGQYNHRHSSGCIKRLEDQLKSNIRDAFSKTIDIIYYNLLSITNKH